jgi:hypothetical protein
VENSFTWLDKAIPVLDNQVLPAFWPAAIQADISMEEVGISDDPG